MIFILCVCYISLILNLPISKDYSRTGTDSFNINFDQTEVFISYGIKTLILTIKIQKSIINFIVIKNKDKSKTTTVTYRYCVNYAVTLHRY